VKGLSRLKDSLASAGDAMPGKRVKNKQASRAVDGQWFFFFQTTLDGDETGEKKKKKKKSKKG